MRTFIIQTSDETIDIRKIQASIVNMLDSDGAFILKVMEIS